MTGVPRPHCFCSTVDFQSTAWSGEYYPEECPDAWQLAYFMNDFPGVYLPAGRWSGARQIHALAGELEGDFQLVLEWPSTASMRESQALLEWLMPISAHIVSLVLRLEEEDLATRLPLLRVLRENYPVSLYSPGGFDTSRSDRLAVLGVGQVWLPAHQPQPVSAGDYLFTVLPPLGLREMRSLLDRLVGKPEWASGIGLFIEPHPGAPQRAKEVRTMIELLGLA